MGLVDTFLYCTYTGRFDNSHGTTAFSIYTPPTSWVTFL